MSAAFTAWQQVGAFFGLLVAGWWVGAYPHDDDGVDVPLRRLAERRAWASMSDPGLRVAADPRQEVET